eukprot:3216298-Alexandrium_andersonii.AAC.1
MEPVQVLRMQEAKPVRQKPGGVLQHAGHTPGGRVRGDVVDGRGVPVHPVRPLEAPMRLEQQRGNPEGRLANGAEQHGRPLEEASGV